MSFTRITNDRLKDTMTKRSGYQGYMSQSILHVYFIVYLVDVDLSFWCTGIAFLNSKFHCTFYRNDIVPVRPTIVNYVKKLNYVTAVQSKKMKRN